MPGLYRHFKGGLYYRLFESTDSTNERPVVVYLRLAPPNPGPETLRTRVRYTLSMLGATLIALVAKPLRPRLWTRPAEEFYGTVERDGKVHQRFAPVAKQ